MLINAEVARQNMIENQVRPWEVLDPRVLDVLAAVRREDFVPARYRALAFADMALPIGNGETMMKPTVEGRMLQALDLGADDRVLEIGTGSGYQTVLLSHLASQVFSIERVGTLVTKARDAIRAAGASNVSLLAGDGTLGWREYAPYDAILVTAGSPTVPTPLAEQLQEGGRLLIPIGDRDEQILALFTKHGESLDRRDIGAARFVPLIGKYGWPA